VQSRIDYLDGLRGIAILLVLGFHAYARWPDHAPYGDEFSEFPLFSYGWLGVQLFFLISGFVIFMTLDKTPSFAVFMGKRFLRLFPAMLIASVLVYLTASFLLHRPVGAPSLIHLLPGLTFIEPEWWSFVLGQELRAIEGAFWSLFVEFKFYVIAGAVYFTLGRRVLIPALLLLYVAFLVIHQLYTRFDVPLFAVLLEVTSVLSLEYFGWFASGALFYQYHHTQQGRYFIAGLCVAYISSFALFGITPAVVTMLMISTLFALSLKVDVIQRVLSIRVFMFFGLVSYPLYLIHENAMISMMVQMPPNIFGIPLFFYPWIVIGFLSVIAFGIAVKGEYWVRGWIKALFGIGRVPLNKKSKVV
jgi:peptidoglycan/LPS O-acetylase OafA/YrhL